jgi:hypothetical protein
MAVGLCVGWLAATVRAVRTRVMNTCYCVVSRFLFLPPPPFTRNFMAPSDDRMFTNCEHHISYTGFMSLIDGDPERQWVMVYVTLFWRFEHSSPSKTAVWVLWLWETIGKEAVLRSFKVIANSVVRECWKTPPRVSAAQTKI